MRYPAWTAAGVVLVSLASCSSSALAPQGIRSLTTIAPPSPGDLSAVLAAARLTLSTSSALSIRLESATVFGTAPKPVEGTGGFDFAASQGNLELNQPSGRERIIFLPISVFVAQPNQNQLLPAGKAWISAGLTEQSLATNFPQFVTQVESLNPALVLSEVVWGGVSAAPVSVPGQGTRGYAVQVDLVKAQAGAGGPSGEAFRRAIGYQLTEMSGATVPTQITVYVGVDAASRVATIEDTPAGAGVGTVAMTLTQFGLPVRVNPPSRAVVADISSLAPGGERENAGGGDSDGA